LFPVKRLCCVQSLSKTIYCTAQNPA
jgi:hypothetical protein